MTDDTPQVAPDSLSQQTVEQWRQIIDVQMHFNEMILRTRALAVSVVLGAYGAAAVTVAQYPDQYISVCNSRFHIGSMVVAFALVLLTAVGILDFGYYYRLLLASVKTGERLEDDHPELSGLTREISRKVPRWQALVVVISFYTFPTIVGLLLLTYLTYGLPQQIRQ